MKFKREPDLIVGVDYLYRWYIIPRNRFFNIYLHKFLGSDDGRALHDHPWGSVSFLLKGELLEHFAKVTRKVPRYLPVFRRAVTAHRLELIKGPAWTLFITGPKIREWGFHCPKGWVPWDIFVSGGRGCE